MCTLMTHSLRLIPAVTAGVCTDPLRRGVGAPPQCPLGVGSRLPLLLTPNISNRVPSTALQYLERQQSASSTFKRTIACHKTLMCVQFLMTPCIEGRTLATSTLCMRCILTDARGGTQALCGTSIQCRASRAGSQCCQTWSTSMASDSSMTYPRRFFLGNSRNTDGGTPTAL